MAAIYYTSSTKDVFKNGIDFKAPINISILSDVFQTPDNLALVTSVALQSTEVIQFFLTFDDVINYLFFGKGLGSLTISGILFCDCSGNIPGLGTFMTSYGKSRGQPVQMSIGSVVFEGIISNLACTLIAEPDTMMEFTLQVSLIKNSLPTTTGTSSSSSGSSSSGSGGGGSSTSSSGSGGGIGGESAGVSSRFSTASAGVSSRILGAASSVGSGFSSPASRYR